MKESPRPPRTFLEFLLTEPRLVPVSEKNCRMRRTRKCRRGQAPRWARGLLPCSGAPSGSGAGMQGAEPPGGTGSTYPGGEDHLKRRRRVRRIVPLPRSPLSLAAGTARREPLSFGFAANHGFCPRGCKGRSPLHEITLILPLPAGKGVGGLSFPFGEGGQKSKLKAR